jgi:hypothetical protein
MSEGHFHTTKQVTSITYYQEKSECFCPMHLARRATNENNSVKHQTEKRCPLEEEQRKIGFRSYCLSPPGQHGPPKS